MIKSHKNQHFLSIGLTVLTKIKRKIKSLSHFIWLILLIIIATFVTYFYDNNKKIQHENLKKTLNNVFLQKTFGKITSELENRFSEIEYNVKEGDSYESIINTIKLGDLANVANGASDNNIANSFILAYLSDTSSWTPIAANTTSSGALTTGSNNIIIGYIN